MSPNRCDIFQIPIAGRKPSLPLLDPFIGWQLLMLKIWPLCTSAKLKLRDRLLGKVGKKSFIALPHKGGCRRLMPRKGLPWARRSGPLQVERGIMFSTRTTTRASNPGPWPSSCGAHTLRQRPEHPQPGMALATPPLSSELPVLPPPYNSHSRLPPP